MTTWRFVPQYLEDFNECKAIMGYRYPETLVEEFLLQGITDKNTKILDLACGPGNVAFIVRKPWEELPKFTGFFQLRNEHGYTNIDGLDPSSGLLAAAQEKGQLLNCSFSIQDKAEGYQKLDLRPIWEDNMRLCYTGHPNPNWEWHLWRVAL